ncbi:MAG: fused response regulator/phosphatase, partial [Nitrospira sp.]
MKFLIADDNATNRLVLAAMLQKNGHEVAQAEDGKGAIEAFTREQPDMIIMDVMMPVMSGYEATERIKAQCGDRFVPVIFLTAVTDEQGLAECIQQGGDDFLTKPFSATILKAKIKAMSRIRDLHATVQEQNRELNAYRCRMTHEQEVARTLLNRAIQTADLDQPNLLYYRAAAEILSGDVLLAASTPTRTQRLMIGDFTGHGLAAAVGALLVTDTFYAMTTEGAPMGDVLKVMNGKLRRALPLGMFCCACVVEFDPAAGRLTVWNGGMPDILVYRPNGYLPAHLPSRHVPLGIISEESLETEVETIQVADGDRIYLYSDGLTEAADAADEMFGIERLVACVSRNQDPERLFGEILQSLHAFCAGAPPHDDIALFELTCDSSLVNVERDASCVTREASLASIESLASRVCCDRRSHAIDATDSPSHQLNDASRATFDERRETRDERRGEAAPWQLSLELDAEGLRLSDPLPVLMQALAEIPQLTPHKESVHMVMAELVGNAVDHGLLGLNSSLKSTPEGFTEYYQQRAQALAGLTEGRLLIRCSLATHDSGGTLMIRVEDSGPGFDARRGVPELNHNAGYSGRGIPL